MRFSLRIVFLNVSPNVYIFYNVFRTFSTIKILPTSSILCTIFLVHIYTQCCVCLKSVKLWFSSVWCLFVPNVVRVLAGDGNFHRNQPRELTKEAAIYICVHIYVRLGYTYVYTANCTYVYRNLGMALVIYQQFHIMYCDSLRPI